MIKKIVKMLIEKLSIVVCLLIPALSLSAQTTNDEQRIKQNAVQRVALFCDFLEIIADPEESDRESIKKQALNLFVGAGNGYYETFYDSNGRSSGRRWREGVLMETTTIRKNGVFKNKPKLLRDYLDRLMVLSYTKVIIETTDVSEIQVSRLQKIGENEYLCTCYFEQKFYGYRDGVCVYKDKTRKAVECHIYREAIEGKEKYEYVTLLGDVTAKETTPE